MSVFGTHVRIRKPYIPLDKLYIGIDIDLYIIDISSRQITITLFIINL